ncbi:ATP-binding protein [Devosia sp. BK]|uniref:slr1658 superfamily regulator n=1 Tax=unclassified Devosia TaxID=196773 RepID=UPI000714E43A|nr:MULTISPECIES: ATP-binding protein [unclassified Devosia]KQT50256.1 ATP-binding protein [Devosia sp. Leaf420]MDV3252013.1 ATP-binding protein [Devosia sp. BK]
MSAPVQFGTIGFSNGPEAVANRVQLADGPLDLSWHHCTTTSDFLGEFFALQRRGNSTQFNETRHGIGYLANELLENAIKFRQPGNIQVECSLEDARFEIKVTNLVAEDVATRFQLLLSELTSRDPGDLLIERIEANAAASSSSGSGLGLLTLMNDYGAELGWVFTPNADAVRLETYASLNLY